ncbi:ubiquitin-protein transferase activating protein [Nowakowskiella sp. JEL0407]|nr:ubiquitin-protein transferase activating protein [Nowakowskiella sp. JEL0407]
MATRVSQRNVTDQARTTRATLNRKPSTRSLQQAKSAGNTSTRDQPAQRASSSSSLTNSLRRLAEQQTGSNSAQNSKTMPTLQKPQSRPKSRGTTTEMANTGTSTSPVIDNTPVKPISQSPLNPFLVQTTNENSITPTKSTPRAESPSGNDFLKSSPSTMRLTRSVTKRLSLAHMRSPRAYLMPEDIIYKSPRHGIKKASPKVSPAMAKRSAYEESAKKSASPRTSPRFKLENRQSNELFTTKLKDTIKQNKTPTKQVCIFIMLIKRRLLMIKVEKITHDRFIPTRTTMDMASAQFNLANLENEKQNVNPINLAYQEKLAQACGLALNKRILSFNTEAPTAREDLKTVWKKSIKAQNNGRRRIPTVPERTLDAPGLKNDYYLNILDWSSQNVVAVALDQKVFLWNAETGTVSEICKAKGSDYISSLQWTADGCHLAVGLSSGDTQIWDTDSEALVRNMTGHVSRVGVLSWDKHILSSGARDGSIWHHDVRKSAHKTAELLGHESDVCGLQWRPDGALLASGGNDNLVNIWDARSTVPRFTKTEHNAGVKAVAWCPWQLSLLATGGGTFDKKIHFWNSTTGANLSTIEAESQITSIQWSLDYKEFVTTHGYPNCDISVWSYPRQSKLLDLNGHDERVLYSSMSPDGQTIASAGGDENLKLWKVFERTKGKASVSSAASAGGENEKKKEDGSEGLR